LPLDADRVGSRCPFCRLPLYRSADRFPEAVEPGEAACIVHTDSASIGTCQRCGNFLCDTCRTRWGDKVLCLACVERALQSGDVVPGRQRAHNRQAAFGLAGGISAWLMTAALVGLIVVAQKGGGSPASFLALVPIILIMMAASVTTALGGLGLSASALRTRGDSMILATLGLLLSGLHFGATVGLMLFGIWLN
jgi:hypothetical protein